MEKWNDNLETILRSKFAEDGRIALATVEEGLPSVRMVAALYWEGAFYVITQAMSTKMRQIGRNPNVSICSPCLNARGIGENLGFVGKPENRDMAQAVAATWQSTDLFDMEDVHTCLLKIRLTTGTFFYQGARHEVDFN